MEERVDIHNNRAKVNRILDKIRNSTINLENKELILSFFEQLVAEGISPGRQGKYLYTLAKLSHWLDKPFKKAQKTDIVKLVMKIEQSEMSLWTKHDFKALLKRFYKWAEGNGTEYPEKIRWLSTTVKNKKYMLPEQILTENEIKRIIQAVKSPRDRALISCLYESGCRIGELLSLKIKNVSFDQNGCVWLVSGKTGMRRIRIISSEIDFREFLNRHPKPHDPEAFVWIAGNDTTKPMSYPRVSNLLTKATKDAGIQKPCNPHSFRKARATHLAGHLPEFMLKQYFGWTPGSDVASVYVRMRGEDLDNALLTLNGKLPIEKKKRDNFSVISCPRCRQDNPPAGVYCTRCGFVLNEELQVAIDKEKHHAANILESVIDDPKYSKRLEKVIRDFTESKKIRI